MKIIPDSRGISFSIDQVTNKRINPQISTSQSPHSVNSVSKCADEIEQGVSG